jgi:uncharacterized protein (DUF1330 family)
MALYPTSEQIQTLLAGPADQPIVMVNLLRYKPRADGGDGERTGAEAYARYAEAMREVVESHGGRFVWLGRVDSLVIGDTQEEFHMIGLVEYPSRQKFVEIMFSDRVRKIAGDRTAGLESQWLIATTPLPLPVATNAVDGSTR